MLFNELFGHEKGAFTGALSNGKKGLFESAEGGTIFLDEIGDISMDMQVALLRAIEEKKHFRLGGTKELETDIRIITATNKDIPRMVEEGRFRKDLFYRLNVFTLTIQPLRNRKEDIIPLSFYFLNKLAERDKVKYYTMTKEVMNAFVNYSWPGNVRELKNCILREISYLPAGEFCIKRVPDEVLIRKINYDTNIYQGETANETIKEQQILKPLWLTEKEAITNTLKACYGNRNQCAKILEISRNTLYRKIQQYEINY